MGGGDGLHFLSVDVAVYTAQGRFRCPDLVSEVAGYDRELRKLAKRFVHE